MPDPIMPAIGGARSFDQMEALAELQAGIEVDFERLHPDDAKRARALADQPETENQE